MENHVIKRKLLIAAVILLATATTSAAYQQTVKADQIQKASVEQQLDGLQAAADRQRLARAKIDNEFQSKIGENQQATEATKAEIAQLKAQTDALRAQVKQAQAQTAAIRQTAEAANAASAKANETAGKANQVAQAATSKAAESSQAAAAAQVALAKASEAHTAPPVVTAAAAPAPTPAPAPAPAPAPPPVVTKPAVSGCEQWRPLVARYSDWNVNDALNVIKFESGCNPNRANTSKTESHYNMKHQLICVGSYGLMQLACTDGIVTDPARNIEIGHEKWKRRGWQPWQNTAKKLGLPY